MSFHHPKLQQVSQTLLPAIYLIWAGLILGVSFIATPVKFQAPHLTMPVALEVGKATFHLFNIVEWSVIVMASVLTVFLPYTRRKWLALVALATVLIAQSFWLLPILDGRADAVIAGSLSEPGHHHWVYIVLEVIKLLLTLVAAWLCSKGGSDVRRRDY